MVKNSSGGNKAKGFARKNLVKRDIGLRVAQEEGEVYAQAVKVMGGSIVSLIDIEGNPLRGHIRGKFRGRGKRDNFIGPNTWLLVGIHDWGSHKNPGDVRDCDVLEVYNDSDKSRLTNTITDVNWSKFISNDTKIIGSVSEKDETGVVFADEATQDYEDLIADQAASSGVTTTLIINDGEKIDVDDI